ncbi:MAG: hypothetical protein ACR2OB_13560 [Solirubrobacteraceae bacterium]
MASPNVPGGMHGGDPGAALRETAGNKIKTRAGSIADWAGAESSAAPAPGIDVKSSLGGGGVSVLSIIALIVGLLGLGAGGFALTAGGARDGKRARPLA